MSAALAVKSDMHHSMHLSPEEVETVERQLGELIATVRNLGDQLNRMDRRLETVENEMEKIQLMVAETHGMTRVLRWVAGITSSFVVSAGGIIWWAADKYHWFTGK